MLMLPFTTLVPLFVRDAGQNNRMKTVADASSLQLPMVPRPPGNDSLTDLDSNLRPNFIQIYKPRCRNDPYVVAMGELRSNSRNNSREKVRRLVSDFRHIAEIPENKPRSLLVKSLVDDSVKTYLSNLSSWTKFDIFKLNEALSSYHGLCLMAEMATAIASHHNLFQTCKLSPFSFYACMREISNNYYRRNPYHTALHACDVLHATHCLMSELPTSSILSPLDKLCLIFAAVCHDVAHPGVNQTFIVKTNHVLYSFSGDNPVSLLERHHFAVGWSILRSFGVLNEMDQASVAYLKRVVLDLILATDIAQHTSMVEAFHEILDSGNFDPRTNESHRIALMCTLMKCADISNPCRPWGLCYQWSSLICDEFFKQGDAERKLNKPISPGCDREMATISHIQKGFIPFIARPLFKMYNDWSKSILSGRLLANIDLNFERWLVDHKKNQQTGKCCRELLEGESAVAETVETSVSDAPNVSSCASHSSSCSHLNEMGEDSSPLFPQRSGFPFDGASRRKYSMPAALFGSTDQSFLLTISSPSSSFTTGQSSEMFSHSRSATAGTVSSTFRRRYSMLTTPTCSAAATAAALSELGISLKETRHSEVLQKLDRSGQFTRMETLEQSAESSSGESSQHPQQGTDLDAPSSRPSQQSVTIVNSCSSHNCDDDRPSQVIIGNQRRKSEQHNRVDLSDRSVPLLLRSSTTPGPAVVPLTVYVSAVSSSDSSQWAGQRRASEGTNLSSYVIGAEHSCSFGNHESAPRPACPASRKQEIITTASAERPPKSRSSLPSTKSPRLVGLTFVTANSSSKSTPIVPGDDAGSSNAVESACRMNEKWTRTGKRWSDGCLTVPHLQRQQLVNTYTHVN